MTQIQDEVMSEYLGECRETLERLNVLVGQLERKSFDAATMRTIARDVHTIKGSSQLFGFNRIGEMAHGIEHCLDRLQDASRSVLPQLIEYLYQGLDYIGRALNTVRDQRVDLEFSEDVKQLLANFAALEGNAGTPAQTTAAPPVTPPPDPGGFHSFDEAPTAQAPAIKADPVAAPPLSQPATVAKDAGPPAAEGAAAKGGVSALTKSGMDEGHGDTIRVHVDLLDNLMNLVGELVLIRNQVSQVSKNSEDENLFKVSQRLNVVTSELQNHVMKTRMQPIGNIMTKFHRVVRDSAKELEKHIELKLEGTETELDKTLIEAVRDPLTHIVRNAIDHGIESPQERQRIGKPETGSLAVRSFHESGHVIIEVADDGKGLDRERIAAKAVEKGLATPEQVQRLNERDIFQFIFLPGFSTADKVSSLSGRGVGMDVVKTNIERIGGTVVLESTLGKGTCIRLRIPLTLAIIPALIVSSAGSRFAIPQVKLVELLRVARDDSHAGTIEFLQERLESGITGYIITIGKGKAADFLVQAAFDFIL